MSSRRPYSCSLARHFSICCYPPSGFGLFICKSIVDVHRGHIAVTSEGEGKGSVFCLQLPMRRASPTAVVHQSESLRVEGIRRHLNASRSPLGSHMSPPPSRRAAAKVSPRETMSKREALHGTGSNGGVPGGVPVGVAGGVECGVQCEEYNNGSMSPGVMSFSLMSACEALRGSGIAVGAEGDDEEVEEEGKAEEGARQVAGRDDERDGGGERGSIDGRRENGGGEVGPGTTFNSLKPLSTPRRQSQASPSQVTPLISQKKEKLPQVSEQPGQESFNRSGSEIAGGVSVSASSPVFDADGQAAAQSIAHPQAGADVIDKSIVNRGSVKANANKGSVKANISTKGSVKANMNKGSVKASSKGPALDASWNNLVVDDSALNRKMLTKLFKTVGQTVEEAVDGQDAVNKVKGRMNEGLPEYDAILMDFVMPIMDGPAATRAIRRLGYAGRIFGVTGNGMAADVKVFTDSGVDRVMVKPFSLDDFHAAVVGGALFGVMSQNDLKSLQG